MISANLSIWLLNVPSNNLPNSTKIQMCFADLFFKGISTEQPMGKAHVSKSRRHNRLVTCFKSNNQEKWP